MNSKAETTTIADQIKELENAETKAFLINDFDSINKIWHPEFTVNTPLNRILKAPEIQGAMRAGLIKYSLLERNIEEIMLRENVVITLGNEVTIPIENAPMAGQKVIRRFTNIWILENNEWRLFSRHASNICD
ncbi:MAG: nuclear transport factor 2 family protein [Bacteroidota bacterium]|nr:nuclear transport factor 2 family protein [Bacteroidota bacterium]